MHAYDIPTYVCMYVCRYIILYEQICTYIHSITPLTGVGPPTANVATPLPGVNFPLLKLDCSPGADLLKVGNLFINSINSVSSLTDGLIEVVDWGSTSAFIFAVFCSVGFFAAGPVLGFFLTVVPTVGFKGLQNAGVCLIGRLPVTFLFMFLKVRQTPVDFLQTDRDLRVGTFPLFGRSELCLPL